MAAGDRQKFPTAKTGMDYARLNTSLAGSKIQKDNNSLFQTVSGLIDGAKTFQGFIEGKFGGLDSDLTNLFTTVNAILEELQERDSTKYSLSLTNDAEQDLADSVWHLCKFDKVVYDDGLMIAESDTDHKTAIIHANAQFLVTGTVRFSTSATIGLIRISVHVNKVRYFSVEISQHKGEEIIPFSGIIECLEDDRVEIYTYQKTGATLKIIPSVQICRLTYQNRGTGRFSVEHDFGDGSTPPGPAPPPPACGDVPPPTGPTWYTGLLASHGVSNCWSDGVTGMSAPGLETDFNALGYWYQKSSGGVPRARMFFPTPNNYDSYVNVSRPDGGWGWDPHNLTPEPLPPPPPDPAP